MTLDLTKNDAVIFFAFAVPYSKRCRFCPSIYCSIYADIPELIVVAPLFVSLYEKPKPFGVSVDCSAL